MNTHEINEVGRRIIHGNYSFKGVFAADTFIESMDISNQLPFAFIVNTDRSESRGRHWVAIIQEHGRFEFFDPLGLGPWHYPNLNIFSVVSYNSHSLQSDFANTSAHICLIFLSIRSRGMFIYSNNQLYSKHVYRVRIDYIWCLCDHNGSQNSFALIY